MIGNTKACLAWGLADLCRALMQRPERSALFVTLGAGDYDDAIVAAIWRVNRRRMAIPKAIAAQLKEWIDTNPAHACQVQIGDITVDDDIDDIPSRTLSVLLSDAHRRAITECTGERSISGAFVPLQRPVNRQTAMCGWPDDGTGWSNT